VTARKLFKIHALSKIMVLHLKRFSYGNHGSTKIYKPLYFPLELVLNRDLLSSPSSEVDSFWIFPYKFLIPNIVVLIHGMLLSLFSFSGSNIVLFIGM
jgi:hypothetical protein